VGGEGGALLNLKVFCCLWLVQYASEKLGACHLWGSNRELVDKSTPEQIKLNQTIDGQK